MSRRWVPWLPAVILLAVSACSADKPVIKLSIPTAKTFLGDRAVAILDAAKGVEVYRIESMDSPAHAGESIEGYPVLSRGKDQDHAFASKLRAILLDDATYWFEAAKGCIFSPGVVFRLKASGETLDVILCYQCDELEILVSDSQGKAIRKTGEDFDRARPALVRLAKVAFPGDPDIQALKD